MIWINSANLWSALSCPTARFLLKKNQAGAGRGFRCGFGDASYGNIMERLKREHGLKLIAAVPTITYKVEMLDGKPKKFIRR